MGGGKNELASISTRYLNHSRGTSFSLGKDNTLHYGELPFGADSRIRTISEPLPGFSGSEFGIASEDGVEYYLFDEYGKHLKTIDLLTGAAKYEFGYDQYGDLIKTTDIDGKTTNITRDSFGRPIEIIAPYGQKSSFKYDEHGYLTEVTNSAGETHHMTYTDVGLLTSFRKPSGHTSLMTYDEGGRLLKDEDAVKGSQNLDKSILANGFEVSLSSAMSRTVIHRVEQIDSNQQRTTISPDGTSSVKAFTNEATQRENLADGTVITTTQGPDPRFGMQVPVSESVITTTGGKTFNASTQRTALLSDPLNPLSLTTLTNSSTLNGRTSTSTYDARDQNHHQHQRRQPANPVGYRCGGSPDRGAGVWNVQRVQ